METKRVTKGVVAELNGMFFGVVDDWSPNINLGWVNELSRAKISDPKFCKKPTDMTYDPKYGGYNPHFEQLKKAKLISVVKTVTTEILITSDQ